MIAPADGWGHPLQITCSEQPPTHQVGVVSVGPDGKPRTADDIKSWELPADIVAPILGPRWRQPPRPPKPPGKQPDDGCENRRC